MSSDGEVDEDIWFGECFADDDELKQDVELGAELAGEDHSDEDSSSRGKLRSGAAMVDVEADCIKPTDLLVIEYYSSKLAETLVHEAILINDIYMRDKTNEFTDGKVLDDVSQSEQLRTDLGTSIPVNFRETNTETGYDSYLIHKFLHSKADPVDVSGDVGFDGREDHFMTSERAYPGLDSSGECVKAEGRPYLEGNSGNDNNNNKMPLTIIDPFSDPLQTIHEDTELVIDTCRQDDVTDKDHVTEKTGSHSKDGEKVDNNAAVTDDSGIEHVYNGDELFRDNDPVESREQVDPAFDLTTENETEHDQQVGRDEPEMCELVSDEEPDELDCCEMTLKQKKRMVGAVRAGNIELLEQLLEKKNADMAMTWYGENLLMAAIRAGKQEMAEFLLDNGIDHTFQAKLVEVEDKGAISMHEVNARQMAYDCNMADLVEMLDHKSNNLFPFIRPKPRTPRLRQPILPFTLAPLDEGMHEAMMINPEEVNGLVKQERERRKEAKRAAAEELERANQKKLEEAKASKEGKRYHLNMDNDSVRSKTCTDLNLSHDELSQVFGPDEGYETMSPVTPLIKFDYNIPDMRQTVSVRGTRSSHLMRAHNTSKADSLRNRIDSAKSEKARPLVGSYPFERRKWEMSRSAPQLRQCSTPRRPESQVRIGLPFLHAGAHSKSDSKFSGVQNPGPLRAKTANSETQVSMPSEYSAGRKRVKSAHSNVSPYSQVAKLLEQSKLFSPLVDTWAKVPQFPAIPRNSSASNQNVVKTRIHYIYTDRNSFSPSCRDVSSAKSDLLPKRKLKC